MNALEACHRARRAWENSQPQLQIAGVLDEALGRVPAGGFVEPVPVCAPLAPPPGAGSTPAPNRAAASFREPDGGSRRGPASQSGGSAPLLQSNGHGRNSAPGTRDRGQKGA